MPRNRKRALTIEEQCQSAEHWYKYLESERDSDRHTVDSFNDAWDYLSTLYTLGDKCLIGRGADCAQVANAPLAALFHYVDLGFYPPPELLFALQEAWHHYEDGGGEVSLEEAFFGKPKPKAGNYAKRRQANLHKLRATFDMTVHVRAGLTRMEAAERIADKLGGEPDTIVRTTRPFRTAKKSEK